MKYLFSFMLLALPCLLLAQKRLEYKVSKPYRVIDAAEKYYISDPTSQQVLMLKRDGKTVFMQLFDPVPMKEVKRNKIEDLPKGYVIEEIVPLEDRLYLFFSVWDKAGKAEQLFYKEIDVENCRFKGKEKRIITVDGKIQGASLGYLYWWSVHTVDKFSFLRSLDKSKLLIQYLRVPEKRNNAVNFDKIGMFVYDETLTELQSGEVTMPYTEKQMDNIDFHLNNQGVPFMLAKVYDDNTTRASKGTGKNRTINYHMECFKIDIPNDKIKITKIEVNNSYVWDVLLYENAQEELYCTGVYETVLNKNEDGSGNKNGLFVFKMEADGTLSGQKFYEIPLEILNLYRNLGEQKANERKNEKGKSRLSGLNLRSVLSQDDNSILLLGERYYRVYHTSRNGSYYTYHYEDVLVTKINSDGSLAWMNKIPKRQGGRRVKGAMGFRHYKMNGKHFIIFIDNPKNLALSVDKLPKPYGDGGHGLFCAWALEDATGKAEQKIMFDTKDVDGQYTIKQFSTDRLLRISEDLFLMEAYKGKKEDILIQVKIN